MLVDVNGGNNAVDVSGGNNTNTLVDVSESNKVDAPGGNHQEKKGKRTKKGAKSTPVPTAKKINAWAIWVDVWREERAGQSDPTPVGANLKAGQRLAKLIPDPAELKEVFRRFLRDQRPFLTDQGHALHLLEKPVDRYRGEPTSQQRDPTEEEVEELLGEC